MRSCEKYILIAGLLTGIIVESVLLWFMKGSEDGSLFRVMISSGSSAVVMICLRTVILAIKESKTVG